MLSNCQKSVGTARSEEESRKVFQKRKKKIQASKERVNFYLSCGRGLINAIFKWKYLSNLDDNLVQTLSNAK